MPLVTSTVLRSEFRLPAATEGLPDDVVDAAIARASRYVERAVDGDGVTTRYTDAVDDLESDPPANETLDLQNGEKFYAMYEVLMVAGIRLRRDGFVKKQQDSGSPGMTSSHITNEFLTIKEVRELAEWYKSRAADYIDDYAWMPGSVLTMGTLQIA